MSTLIAPLTTRIQTLFFLATSAGDDVEQGLIDPPLKNQLRRFREDFHSKNLHLLICPASPELLSPLLAALTEALLSPPSVCPPLLYSLVPEGYPCAPWKNRPPHHSRQQATTSQGKFIHHYPPQAFPQAICLHVLSDLGAVLKSPVLLGELSGYADLVLLVSQPGMPVSASAGRFRDIPGYAEAVIECVFAPQSAKSGDGSESIGSFDQWFRDYLNALLGSPRYDGYLLIAASRKLARLKSLMQYAIQRRQEQIKSWSFEVARRKKGQDGDTKNRAELIAALEKLPMRN